MKGVFSLGLQQAENLGEGIIKKWKLDNFGKSQKTKDPSPDSLGLQGCRQPDFTQG